MATTKLQNLINPQALGAYIEGKLVDSIKLSPLAVIGTELQGRAGNTLTLPTWVYIGDAKDLAEGIADVPVALEAGSTEVVVKKAAKSVEITDEAVLSGYGDPVNEVAKQLLSSIASKVEADCFTALGQATLAHTAPAINGDAVADSLVKFGEDLDGDMYLFINPADYAEIRKNPQFIFAGQPNVMTIGGTVGFIYNCAVVVSNRVAAGSAFVVKPGALGIELKRDVNVESDRDILRKVNVFAVDKHYVSYLRDASKVIKITKA